jgi:hypothetical protein
MRSRAHVSTLGKGDCPSVCNPFSLLIESWEIEGTKLGKSIGFMTSLPLSIASLSESVKPYNKKTYTLPCLLSDFLFSRPLPFCTRADSKRRAGSFF